MWKKIQDTQYFLLFTQNHGYELCVTDYSTIWTTLYTEETFLSQLKLSNDGLELEHDNDFVQKGLHLLSNPEQLKKLTIEKKENGKTLFITMTISFGFPFYFECKLSKGSDELYFQKITQSLLKTISDLRSSQSELRHLLIKKDNEIEEYKCEGGEIVLRHLKTVAFNDEDHMKKHKVYEENFGTSDIPSSLIESADDVPVQNLLKQEPKEMQNPGQVPNIKAEPVLNIKTELVPNIKTEPVTTVKMEPKTEVIEAAEVPIITASVSFQQEGIKKENKSSYGTSIPRKKSKFNF